MTLREDLSLFMDDFGVIAESGRRRAKVILDAQDASVLGDRVQSTNYTMTYLDPDFPDLSHGDWVKVDGRQFEVIQVNSIDDGRFKQAILQRT